MTSPKKNYFLAPSWDYAPGVIAIGNIITSPKRLVPPLAATTSIGSLSNSGPTLESVKRNVEWTLERATSGKLGIWTKFVETIGLNVGIESSTNSAETFKFDTMLTEEWFPDGTYLQCAFNTNPVRDFLERHRLKKSLYVIVGTKTVSGAAVRRHKGGSVGGISDIGLDAAVTEAPVSLGPSAEVSHSSSSTVSFEGSSDFVFAFRLRKIKMKASGIVVQDDYNRGTMFGAGDEDEEKQSQLCVDGLEEHDYELEQGSYECISVLDDDAEIVEVSILK